ncbi:MAG: pectate lyase, partial [Bacteroidales bacterium]|nr:pectate lyase [Bacteroidales bacterium]
DCKSLQPVSEIGAQRRYSFYTLGGQCLFQRIWSEYGYHDFAVGAGAPGPNAFVQCWSISPHSFSGTIEALSSGVLFDICAVHENALRFSRPDPANEGYSYTTANSMFWNSTAAIMSCPKPGTAQNWAFGAWAQFSGKGYWYEANSHISPWSLFYAQLGDRRGKDLPGEAKLITLSRGGTSSRDDALRETLAAQEPLILLCDWIDTLSLKEPISLNYDSKDSKLSKAWLQEPYMTEKKLENYPALQLKQGLLVRDGKILTGGRFNPMWWRGSLLPKEQQTPHITRYALEPEAYRVVDDLDQMTDNMQKTGILVADHNYGLWYDRRRDDHERTSRIDGEVRAPFYELPFARSGQGRAWDGLSQYDLTKWNNWYWNRLKTYADLAEQKALVLFHQQYFQHNIIEAGAHWADFPWRSANNVNQTDFPEPVPYAGNKRVFMAEHFYDLNHPVRRSLHRNYIRKCLDNFAGNSSVLHFISAEFTGPLHFVEFWFDVIAEWEKESGKNALIALSTTKEVQDAILKDPVRSKLVEVIDIRYWFVDANGREFAPKGGLNLAPRQFQRIEKPAKTSADEVYNMVSTYRLHYPDKAVLYSADSYPEFAWAAFMAGASLCALPQALPED